MSYAPPRRWPSVTRWTWALRVQLVLLGASWPPLFVVSWWPWLLGVVLLLAGGTVWTTLVLRRARLALEQRVEHAQLGLLSWWEMTEDRELAERLEKSGVLRPGESIR